jgi:hypothetical protein
MRNQFWTALIVAALAAGTVLAREDEPPTFADTPTQAAPSTPAEALPPPTATIVPELMPMQEAPAVQDGKHIYPSHYMQALARNKLACPKCGGPMGCSDCGDCCAECGRRQRKVARFLDWLIYIPLDKGKTKCCPVCVSRPPPAWAFFPCEGNGRCANCAVAGQAPVQMSFAKAAGETTTNKVVSTAYPPSGPAPQPEAPPSPPRISSYKPQNIAAKMPVLDPAQFRKSGANGN